MKRPDPRAEAEREWRRQEQSCARSVKAGLAFLTDDDGELRLFADRPVLRSCFASAWKARSELERLCRAEGVELPAPGISSEYVDWPALGEIGTEAFLVFGWSGFTWREIDATLLVRHENIAEPVAKLRAVAG